MSDKINPEDAKTQYKKLTPCFCPAIQEITHFNAEGLRHLQYKMNRPRNKKDCLRRLALIQHIEYVICNATTSTQTIHNTDPSCTLWALGWVSVQNGSKNLSIRIILRRIGAGNVHFFSIMNK